MSLVNLRFIADFENASYQLSPLVLLSLSLSVSFIPLNVFYEFQNLVLVIFQSRYQMPDGLFALVPVANLVLVLIFVLPIKRPELHHVFSWLRAFRAITV